MIKKRFSTAFCALLLMFWMLLGLSVAQGTVSTPKIEEECCSVLNDLDNSLKENLDRQKKIVAELKQVKDDETRKELEIALESLKTQEKSLENVFNKRVFGGINPNAFANGNAKNDDYQWQEELLMIVKPLFAELRSLTEKPRERDRLNYENLELTEKYKALTEGLQNLNDIPIENATPQVKKRVEALQVQWSNYQQELLNQKQLIEIQLKEMENNEVPLEIRIKNALSSIFLGRGLIFLMAVLSATAVILIFGVAVKRFYMLFERRRQHKKRTRGVNTRLRFLWIMYNLAVYTSATLAFLSVIYIQGDMVLFGLSVLLLFFGLISLRNYAPQYVSELKIFLNLGAVREGERIMYRGIPWEVRRLSFYCSCVNPALENGRIRISLSEIAELNSRPFNSEEEWFPTEVGDNIFLPDGNYAKVKRQTPEMVYLDSFFREIMIPTADFYSMKVQNVAEGFYATPTFGLDFCHADLPVSEVANAFEGKVREKLYEIGVAEYLRSISVQVKRIIYGQAIEYAVIMEYDGECAGSFFRIERLVNHACLEVCQEKGWRLPRQQISVSDDQSVQQQH